MHAFQNHLHKIGNTKTSKYPSFPETNFSFLYIMKEGTLVTIDILFKLYPLSSSLVLKYAEVITLESCIQRLEDHLKSKRLP